MEPSSALLQVFKRTLILQIYTNESRGLCCWRFKRTRILRICTNETEVSIAGVFNAGCVMLGV